MKGGVVVKGIICPNPILPIQFLQWLVSDVKRFIIVCCFTFVMLIAIIVMLLVSHLKSNIETKEEMK